MSSFTSCADDRRGAGGDGRRRPSGRGRHRSRRRRTAGQGAAARRDSWRSTGIEGLGGIGVATAGARARHAGDARGRSWPTRRSASSSPALADASRDRRLARHARPGNDRRQRDERLAGDGHRRPAALLRRVGDASLGDGERPSTLAELWTGPGHDRRDARRAADRGRPVPLPAPGTGSCYVRLEYRRQMEIAVVGATAVVTLDGDRVTDARIAITALAPTIRRVPEAEAALAGTDGGAEAVAAAAAAAAAPRRRSATCAARPTTGRAMAEVITRRAIAAALTRARGGIRSASPRAPRCTGRGASMKVTATLTVNGTTLPGRARSAREPARRRCARSSG